ncbi:N-acetyldiaminopimelate deacetylase [Rossellomorea aquimaris]|uniref:N-acetyldiaminopimelate deacetylase n=1 Tax=Rossellomorea aquimaris TaxID=189382 RepID=UPI001CD80A60|nr:N-acetyldiaminopimelate deacetylase [Rossellomorea aquimaris]MCA1056607.1 N-acetyldiaminopimelate deacetylase [Rossellomorea aquimaris]
MTKTDFKAIRRDLHKIPELGFQEYKTQEYLLNYLLSLPQHRFQVKKWKTGLFVKVKGTAPTRIIGYRSDIDGLPIEEETGLDFKSDHEGRMHACGHDLHMSIALGVLTHFVHHPIPDDLVFIFQPAEEGPGGAEPMLQSEEMKEWMPNVIFALHIAPEYKVGTIAIKEGLLFANTSELFLKFKGKGGHAAYPHQTKDMIVVASHFVTQLQTIVSRNVDPLDSAVITIGKMESGTVQNIIAETATLEGTIRTLSKESMESVKERLEAMIEGMKISYDCEIEVDYGSMYRQVYNDHEWTRDFISFLESNDDHQLVICKEAMTGEDFGYMLEKIPGFMFWLGVDSDHGLHHSKLNPDEEAIDYAISTLTAYIGSLSTK